MFASRKSSFHPTRPATDHTRRFLIYNQNERQELILCSVLHCHPLDHCVNLIITSPSPQYYQYSIMHGQRPSIRKKLTPKKPTKKIAMKCRIYHMQNVREETLTENQRAWARSLAVSLSGWRNRQKFYKDHPEAHIQAEAESKAAEAERQAREITQRVAGEEDAEVQAILQAEAKEEKAEAWAHKAWEMHRAGKGVRKEKHQYFGWDPEEEEYPRNLTLEALIAERKARRKAKLKTEYGYSDNEDSNDDSDSDSNWSPEVKIPNSAPRSPLRPAPVVERAPIVDWRDKARSGVIKKKLSVTKGWSAVTWNQKSNIQERLLVLEDDEYNVQELLDGKATSEQVTSIILERAAGKQHSSLSAAQPTPQPEQFVPPHKESENVPPAWFDPALRQSASASPNQESSPDAPSESKSLAASSPHSTLVSRQQSNDAETVQDNTQPFSFDESYYPQASRRLKRKRDDDADSDIEDEVAVSTPTFKKRKVEFVTEDGLAVQALQDIKRAVSCGVFRSARASGPKPLPPSRIVFSAETSSIEPDGSRLWASSLDYLYPEMSEPRTNKSFYSISKCAFDNMMAELRFLTNTTDEDTAIHIYDPDSEEDFTCTPVKPEDRIKQNRRNMQRQAPHIVIMKDEQSHVVFQGDATILNELLKTLREQPLLHYIDWEWDGLRLRRSNDLLWYLSPQTQNTLVDLENRLRRRSRTEGIEIAVSIVNDRPNGYL